MHQRTHLIFDLETVPDHELYTPPEPVAGTDRPLPPTYAHCPVVIRVLWLDPDYSFKRLGVVGEERPEQTERSILEEFIGFIDRHKPRLVTFNGRTFDLPVIAHRALRHGLSAYLINTWRQDIVIEDDLLEAIKEKNIRYACDVFKGGPEGKSGEVTSKLQNNPIFT